MKNIKSTMNPNTEGYSLTFTWIIAIPWPYFWKSLFTLYFHVILKCELSPHTKKWIKRKCIRNYHTSLFSHPQGNISLCIDEKMDAFPIILYHIRYKRTLKKIQNKSRILFLLEPLNKSNNNINVLSTEHFGISLQ